MADLLKGLDGGKGGISETAKVKNKDRLIAFDYEAGWTKEFIDEVLNSLAELKLGYIRTLTIIRSQKA